MKKLKINNIKKNRMPVNWKVIVYSIIALICLGLVYTVDWIFIVPVLILIWLSQRELFGRK